MLPTVKFVPQPFLKKKMHSTGKLLPGLQLIQKITILTL